MLVHIWHKVRPLNDPGHNELPAQLLAGVSQVHEGWAHEGGPEHNGEVARGHLVHLLLLLNLVQVLHHELEGLEVWSGQCGEELVDACLL